MAETLKLSVVIPAFNEEATIGNCLEKLLKQSDQIFEIIVVNNNSKDSTGEIIERIQSNNPIVKVVNELTPGLIAARNSGLAAATGDVIARIDADSAVEPNWALAITSYFSDQANKDIAAATGPTYFYDAPFGKAIEPIWTALLIWSNKILANTGELFGSNMILRRSAWDTIKDSLCTAKEMMEDLDISIHTERLGLKIGFVSKAIVGIASRRQRMSPLRFWEYQLMWVKTYTRHGMYVQTIGISAMAALGAISQAVIWLPLRSFNPVTRKFSLKYLFSNQEERILP